MSVGSFRTDSYIQVMDWLAERAERTFERTQRLTVIVQDNGSVHLSALVRQQWERWADKGLIIFRLPKYCSQMNLIEVQWHQLKTHELAGRMFEDEYDASSGSYRWNASSKSQG